jgi:23S rRNA pseudoU1915 N3-methylase RlmH
VNCYGLFVYATKGDESFTNMTAVSQYEDRRKNARALYEQYGKPLEAEHKGEYVVISNRGKTIVGKSLAEVVTDAIEQFGKGHSVFKIGSRAVGSFR